MQNGTERPSARVQRVLSIHLALDHSLVIIIVARGTI